MNDFNAEQVAQNLRQFRIRNVRSTEAFEIGAKRFSPQEVLIPLRGKRLLACTDERLVKELLNPQTGETLELSQHALVRLAGAAFGIVDAIRNERVTITRKEILSALSENEVVAANHVDSQVAGGVLSGCGYAALRELPEGGSVFDRPAMGVDERAKAFESMGVLRMVLEGEHTAQGFVINPFSDKVLDPTSSVSAQAFFSLDLGAVREIVHWISGALSYGEEAAHSILVKIVRNTTSAVFALSGGTINEAVYLEREDREDQIFAGIIHEALAEFKERGRAIIRMMEARAVHKTS